MKKIVLTISTIGFACVIFMSVFGFTFLDEGKVEILQKDLDMSTTSVKLSVSGSPLGDVSIAHDGRDVSADSSFRDSYTNMISSKEIIKSGTIFTKRAYIKNSDGSKGNLEMIFAMIKCEKGYFKSGGDWEYITIPYEKNNDYMKHPNGMLPKKVDNEMRGKIMSCTGCHGQAEGNDFVFTN